MPISVRRALPSDLAWLLEQLRAFSAFMDTKVSLFDDGEYASQFISGLIENQIVMIAEGEDKIPQGFIAGTLGAHPFLPKLTVLSELFWWIDPAYRMGRAASLLLKEWIAFGKEHAQWVIVCKEANSPISPNALLKRGFKHLESAYLMEIA